MKNKPEPYERYKTDSLSFRAFQNYFSRQKRKMVKEGVVNKDFSMGAIASYYLDCFLLFSKTVCSDTAVAAGVCDVDCFTKWREDQRNKGHLLWTVDKYGKYEYSPGTKITKYIDAVLVEHGLGASKGYVDHKVETLVSAFDKLIIFFDPPVTPTKRTYYQTNPHLLFTSKSGRSVLRKIIDEADDETDIFLGGPDVHPDYSKALNS